MTRKGDLKVVISDQADWSDFERSAEAILARFGARVVVRLDGLDERFWDLQVGQETVTLHLQHHLGISLHASSAEGESLVKRIEQLLDSKP